MKSIKAQCFVIGTGEPPIGQKDFRRIDNWHWLPMGTKGKVWIHLHGKWWEIITPTQLQIALANLSCNKDAPVVTVSV